MKRFVRESLLAAMLPRVIISLVAVTHCMKANATDFIDIIRMTAEHPSIISAQENAGAALFNVDVAKAPANLQLSAGISSLGYSGQPGYENNYFSPHVNISKVLYDHGRTDTVVLGKEAEYQMQHTQIRVTREVLNQQVLALYTTALTNTKVGAVLDQEIKALTDLLQRIKGIASIDSGRASEINQVATRLSSVIASREAVNTAQQQAWQQLVQLVNKPIEMTNELPDLKASGFLPADLDVAKNALQDNPSLVLARYKRDVAIAAVKLASKWNKPKWTVQLTLNSLRVHGDMEPFKAATLQVSSDMNLWDGGAGIASVKGESSRLAAAEQDIDATARNLNQQVAQLWVSLALREKQIVALSEQYASALQTWQAGESQFFAGKRPLTDLISFATDYYSSLASYEEQRVQNIATQWQIVAVLGKLSQLASSVKSLPSPRVEPVLNPKNTTKMRDVVSSEPISETAEELEENNDNTVSPAVVAAVDNQLLDSQSSTDEPVVVSEEIKQSEVSPAVEEHKKDILPSPPSVGNKTMSDTPSVSTEKEISDHGGLRDWPWH